MWTNIFANIITTLIYTTLGVLTFLYLFYQRRRKLFRFFGINKNKPDSRIYISLLHIKPEGTETTQPITRGYTGPAISKLEYDAAVLVRNILRSKLVGVMPKSIQEWVKKRSITLIPLDPKISISPKEKEESSIAFDNLIIIGSNVYNRVAEYYLEHSSCCFAFLRKDNGERVIRILKRGLENVEVPGRSVNKELAVIQKINDEKHKNAVFICAGLGSSATYGSVRYLVENWERLYTDYKDAEFALCLAFPEQLTDSELVVEPIVLHEFENNC